mgnify:CR=1 FL=1
MARHSPKAVDNADQQEGEIQAVVVRKLFAGPFYLERLVFDVELLQQIFPLQFSRHADSV